MIFHAPYLSSRKMPNINICILQFFRNFPSLDVFDHAVSKYHDFLTFILIFLTVIFCSYRSRGAFIFFVSLLCLSILLLAFVLTFVSVFAFSLLFVFLLSLRIVLSSGFEFTRSPFTGGSSASTAIVLVER